MYHLLPSSPAASSQLKQDTSEVIPLTKRHNALRLSLLGCIICTILNAVLAIYSLQHQPQSPSFITRKDIHLLRRPSQFIRFDEIDRPSPPVPKQFDNYPILLAQIDEEQKSKVFENLSRKYTSFVGTIVPEDKRVFINKTVSTIIQFRAIDFGMESCELRLSLPKSSSETSLPPSQSFPLIIYRLNATIPLDIETLSYNTRPPRVTKVADVHFAHESRTTWQRGFRCALEEVLTFELACSETSLNQDCQVEWWQDKEHPDPGAFHQ